MGKYKINCKIWYWVNCDLFFFNSAMDIKYCMIYDETIDNKNSSNSHTQLGDGLIGNIRVTVERSTYESHNADVK
jgi:hypothetical protein